MRTVCIQDGSAGGPGWRGRHVDRKDVRSETGWDYLRLTTTATTTTRHA